MTRTSTAALIVLVSIAGAVAFSGLLERRASHRVENLPAMVIKVDSTCTEDALETERKLVPASRKESRL